jgi:hypothetical protein
MRPEARFWITVRKHLPGHAIRVENCIGNGTPDVNVCANGREAWIELKIKENGIYKIRKEQHVWGCIRARSGGRVFVIGHDPKTGAVDLFQYPFEVRPINDTYKAIVGIPVKSCSLKSFSFYILPCLFPESM